MNTKVSSVAIMAQMSTELSRSGFTIAKESGVRSACIRWRELLSSATSRFRERPIPTNLSMSSILRSGDASPGALIRWGNAVHLQQERIRSRLKMRS